jgi:hypothetical protein
MVQLVPGRECGECTQCCIVPAIDNADFQKAPASVCRHCDKGCNIYETRPQTCRTYYCGWRWLDIFPDDWRPDQSGVFVQLDNNVPRPPGTPVGIILVLVGNPLKTLRQPWFLDFVTKGVTNNKAALYLGLPGPKGRQSASLPLNTRDVIEATKRSRAEVRIALEKVLKRLSSHDFIPHVLEFSGHDMST